jgi:hypothetical protein
MSIILKWILSKWDVGTWAESFWLRIGQVTDTCECGNESLHYIKVGNFWTNLESVSFCRSTLLHGVNKYFPGSHRPARLHSRLRLARILTDQIQEPRPQYIYTVFQFISNKM